MPYSIELPFSYLNLHRIPLKNRDVLAYRYNQFIKPLCWEFVQNYNYHFATNQLLTYYLLDSRPIFEGELKQPRSAIFTSFKILDGYFGDSTDFYEWDQLAKIDFFHHLDCLTFSLDNHWLSMPTEAFYAAYQNLKKLAVFCHCTGGFDNFINAYELEKELKKHLPRTEIEIEIKADFYW